MEKFVVDKNICIGCGACMAIASDTFTIGDDGLAETMEEKGKVNEMSKEELEEATDAKEGCPVEAIQIIDEN